MLVCRAETGITLVRTVTPDGTNANLGQGPEPELEAFLAALRQRVDMGI